MKLPDWYEEMLREAEMLAPPDICQTVRRTLCGTLRKMADLTVKTGNEYGAPICLNTKTKQITAGSLEEGTPQHGPPPTALECPPDTRMIGDIHSHPLYPGPSPRDVYGGGWPRVACVVAAGGTDHYLGSCWTNVPEDAKEASFEIARLEKQMEEDAMKLPELRLAARTDKQARLELERLEEKIASTYRKLRELVDDFARKYGCELDCRQEVRSA